MTSLEDIARRLDRAAAAVTIGGRTLLHLDTNPVPDDWTHITKIDPEADKRLPLCYPLYLQHTSAVEVGGSKDVTGYNTEQTLELVANRPVPAFQEPSGPSHVTDRTRDLAEFLAIPEVLNGDAEALVGQLGAGVEHIREEIAPKMIAEKFPISPGELIEDRLADFAATWMLQEAVFEAYIIMNPDSAAAREANVTDGDMLSPETAKQRALAAERHLESELVYLEYSGTYGGEEAADILEAVSDSLAWSKLWYGGGLDDRENARAVLDAGADAVVVGNVFHDIAEEELTITDDALDHLDADADRDAVAKWVTDEVDVADTAAASYLSTNVDVSAPTDRAEEYLVTTIRTWLAVQSLREELDDADPSSVATLRDAVSEASLPGRDDVTDAAGEDLLSDVLIGLFADRYGVEYDDLPVEHVSFELPTA